MTSSSLLRAPLVALTLAAFVASSSLVTPAAAGRRDDAAAAIAIGVGALVIGGILASKARKARQRERAYRYDYDYVQPRYRTYRHAPSYSHRPSRYERFND